MSKKIIAIGGGNIGEYENGIVLPYETKVFDEEIINITDIHRPNALFVGLADPMNIDNYFYYFNNVFSKRYGCKCKKISLNDLRNKEVLNDLFDWADIIYVGGGNTFTLMNYCKKYDLYHYFLKAYDQGKVMCGISAGGMFWFRYGNTVNPLNKGVLLKQPCLGFENLVFSPHCDEINGHFENVQNLIKNENLVAISLSNCCALEIINQKFRFICSSFSRYKIEPFGIRSFWKDDNYRVENIELAFDYLSLEDLLKNDSFYCSDVREDVKQLLKRRNIYFK